MRGLLTVLAAIALAACSKAEDSALAGYVEADLLYLAAQDPGVLQTLQFREGDQVKAGDVLFTLDPARAELSAAEARKKAEGATLRADVEGAMAKQVAEAETTVALAEKTFNRSQSLVRGGAVTREKFDVDAAALAAAKSRLEALRAERDAMLRDAEAAGASALFAEKRLADMQVLAPVSGSIERIYRRPGEFVAIGDPVVALLAPENLKIRFFAPQDLLSSLEVGGAVRFTCDGCNNPKSAKISFIAAEPQFAPPVIYSLDQRDRLVFLVEARADEAASLRPGLPVTVERR